MMAQLNGGGTPIKATKKSIAVGREKAVGLCKVPHPLLHMNKYIEARSPGPHIL
jgi:hypothetical protein